MHLSLHESGYGLRYSRHTMEPCLEVVINFNYLSSSAVRHYESTL